MEHATDDLATYRVFVILELMTCCAWRALSPTRECFLLIKHLTMLAGGSSGFKTCDSLHACLQRGTQPRRLYCLCLRNFRPKDPTRVWNMCISSKLPMLAMPCALAPTLHRNCQGHGSPKLLSRVLRRLVELFHPVRLHSWYFPQCLIHVPHLNIVKPT